MRNRHPARQLMYPVWTVAGLPFLFSPRIRSCCTVIAAALTSAASGKDNNSAQHQCQHDTAPTFHSHIVAPFLLQKYLCLYKARTTCPGYKPERRKVLQQLLVNGYQSVELYGSSGSIRSCEQMAGRQMARLRFRKLGAQRLANIHHHRTTGVKSAADRRVCRTRHFTLQNNPLGFDIGVRLRDCRKSAFVYGCCGVS